MFPAKPRCHLDFVTEYEGPCIRISLSILNSLCFCSVHYHHYHYQTQLVKVRAMAAEAVDVLMSLSGNSDLTPHMDEIMSCAKGNRDV